MPTREEVSGQIRRDLAARGVTPSDPIYEFALDSLELMNAGVADFDDELDDMAARLAWLAHAPTWVNRRGLDEFDAFVDSKLMECGRAMAAVCSRWEMHKKEHARTTPTIPEP